jgi:hypothetical protein
MGPALLVAAVLGGAPAETENPVQLRWDSPQGCPDRDAVLRQIERFVPLEHRRAAAPLHAEGRLVAGRRGWSLDLVVRGEGSHMERTLHGDDCRVLTSAAALVIAVMVEPATVLEEVEKSIAPEQHDSPPLREVETPRASPAAVRNRPGGFMAVRGLVTWGGAPRTGGAVALAGGVRFARWRIGVEALLDVPRRAMLSDTEDAGARIGLAAAALRGCHTPGGERVEVPLCAGFEAGAMWATGFGLAQPKTAIVPWGAFILGTGLSITVHRHVALRIDVDGVVPVHRARFVVEDREPVYRPAPLGARAGAAIEVRFP